MPVAGSERPGTTARWGVRSLRAASSSWQRRIAGFLRSPARERRLFLRAVPILAAVRIALWLLPLRTTLHLTCRARGRRGPFRADGPGVHDLAQAVRRASREIPKGNCLTQALAGHIMFGRAGHESEVRIGVRQDPERGIEAHAWLEHRGEVVLGEFPDMGRFTPMPSLERYLGRHVPR